MTSEEIKEKKLIQPKRELFLVLALRRLHLLVRKRGGKGRHDMVVQ